MTAKEKGYGVKKKVIATIKVQDEKHLMKLLAEGNEHFFHPSLREHRSADIYIHLSETAGDELMWFIYYCETDEQQEFNESESLAGQHSWLKPILEKGSLYCKIYSK